MEMNAPAVTLILAAIAGIAWLIRLESKGISTAAQVQELKTDAKGHMANLDIHHKGDDLDRRFDTLETRLSDLHKDVSESNRDLKKSMDRVNDRLDVVLTK